jgi:Uma2 family endonuclease
MNPRQGRSAALQNEPVWRLSTERYHKMIEAGILTGDDHVELLEGWLVPKMVKNPRHRVAARLMQKALERALPEGWDVDKEAPITLADEDSEPEPDVLVIRGDTRRYSHRHPGPGDVALVVEVADSSLERDRGAKKRLYAAAGIPIYWIVNLIDRRIEVYSLPSGACANPEFGHREDFISGQAVPVVMDGREVATIPVCDVLPD